MRPLGRILLFCLIALIAGTGAAAIWLQQPGRGALELLPEVANVATATPTSAATATSATSATSAAPTVSAVAQAVEGQSASVAAGDAQAVAASANGGERLFANLLQRGRANLDDVNLGTPTPTATSTPRPPVESVEGVVNRGGGALWDEDTGTLVAYVEQGALIRVTARSTDGNWLLAETEAGETGWIAVDAVILFDQARLRSEDVMIIPITPTPTPFGGGMAVDTEAGAGDVVVEASASPLPMDDGKGGTTGTAGGPTARVNVVDARLNLRAGPGSNYAIIAKAEPNAQLALLGRDASGQWLQVRLSDGGFAWGAAEYLDAGVPVRGLPVVTDVSDAATFSEQATPIPGSRGAQGMRHTAPGPTQAGATGLTGKLAIQTTWGGDIYIYDFATGDLRLLTGGFDPAISPDGSTVAFTRQGGEQGLYLIDIDGSNERLIFSGRDLLFGPKFSPDGQYIVFERGDNKDICLEEPRPCIELAPDKAEELGPDETRIESVEELARVDINGQNYRDIPALLVARAPDWNEGGIVYQSPAGIQRTKDDPNFRSELVFFNIQKQYELDPDWQPGRGNIVFQRREASHWEIFSVRPDGSGLVGLTRPATTFVDQQPSNVAPAWSPDGQHIVFLSNRTAENEAGPWRVWVMNADGSNQRPLPIDLDFTYTYVAEQMLDWGR